MPPSEDDLLPSAAVEHVMQECGYELIAIMNNRMVFFPADGSSRPIVVDVGLGTVVCRDLHAQVVDWGGVSTAVFNAALDQL